MTEILNKERWLKVWEGDEWLWHMDRVNPYLVKYFDTLCNDNYKGKRILVPLCGATRDLKFFFDKGLTVVGVEISEIAIKKFFNDNNLTYSILNESKQPKVYVHNENLKIYQLDLYQTTSELLEGLFDYWWDIGSFCAIEDADRQHYFDHLDTLMAPSARCIMEAFEFDLSIYPGPPKPIWLIELKKIVANRYKVTELSRLPEDELEDGHTAKLNYESICIVYLLEKSY